MTPLSERFWAKVDVRGADDCWEWTASRLPKGYGKIGAGGKGRGWVLTHRVSFELSHGPIPWGLEVLHSCDNPPCVNPAHLFIGTSADNHSDMVSKDRHLCGERNASAKLTDVQVRAMRASTESSIVIGRALGVNGSHVRAIRRGEAWRHLEDLAS